MSEFEIWLNHLNEDVNPSVFWMKKAMVDIDLHMPADHNEVLKIFKDFVCWVIRNMEGCFDDGSEVNFSDVEEIIENAHELFDAIDNAITEDCGIIFL